MVDRYLRIEEVALLVGKSTQTLNNWYRWKAINRDNEYAKLLPDYIQEGERQIRYWKLSDIAKIKEFEASIPKGRHGILGEITQKYIKKENN